MLMSSVCDAFMLIGFWLVKTSIRMRWDGIRLWGLNVLIHKVINNLYENIYEALDAVLLSYLKLLNLMNVNLW